MASDKKKNRLIAKSYRAEIVQAEKNIEKEKKAYHKAVKALLKADGILKSLEKVVNKYPTDSNLERLVAAKKELSSAALEYKAISDSIDTQISVLEQKSDYLSRFYFQIDKEKDANKEKARFENYYEKQINSLCKVSKNSDDVVYFAFEEGGRVKGTVPVRDTEETSVALEFEEDDMLKEETTAPKNATAPKAAPAQQYAYAPQVVTIPQYTYPAQNGYYGYPYAPAAPQPEASDVEVVDREINIAPLDLDITEIVSEAVNATIKSFSDVIGQKIAEYAEKLVIPTPAVSAQASAEDVEGRADALAVVAQEQAFVVSKLSELIEGVKEVMDAINDLTVKSAEILEKQKAASEVQNELAKTQRTTMREIQGIQVRQKLVITEQEALVAEQTVAFEHHKLVAEAQQALSEQQQISVDEINALVENQKALNASVKETVDSNKSIVAMAEKTAEAQKTLTEKQQELISVQKEAMAAHRQLARGQRTADAKRRSEDKKTEEAAPAAAEAPAADAAVTE